MGFEKNEFIILVINIIDYYKIDYYYWYTRQKFSITICNQFKDSHRNVINTVKTSQGYKTIHHFPVLQSNITITKLCIKFAPCLHQKSENWTLKRVLFSA